VYFGELKIRSWHPEYIAHRPFLLVMIEYSQGLVHSRCVVVVVVVVVVVA